MNQKKYVLLFIILFFICIPVFCGGAGESGGTGESGSSTDYIDETASSPTDISINPGSMVFDLVVNKPVNEYIEFFSPSDGTVKTEFYFPFVNSSDFVTETVLGLRWSFNSTAPVDIRAKFYAYPNSSYFNNGEGFMLQGDETQGENIIKLNYSVSVSDTANGTFSPLITMSGDDISSSNLSLSYLETSIRYVDQVGAIQDEAYIKLTLNAPSLEGSQYFMSTVYSGYVIVEASVI